jgi:hypothetical protein
MTTAAGHDNETQRLLPPEFAILERWAADWALPTERERYTKRLASSMAELKEFYDEVLAVAPDAKKYLDELDLNDMPESAQRLLWLLFMLIMASYPVELWGQPRTPDCGAADFYRVTEPSSFPV